MADSREGTLFQRDWFSQPITDYPPDVTLVRYWDPAATKEGDYTAGALLGEKDGIYYVVDIQRVRTRPAGVEQLIRQTAERDRERGNVAIFMEQEPGSSGVSMIDNYARKVLKGFRLDGRQGLRVKDHEAHRQAAQQSSRNIKSVQGAWIERFSTRPGISARRARRSDRCVVRGDRDADRRDPNSSSVPIISPIRVGPNTRWKGAGFGSGPRLEFERIRKRQVGPSIELIGAYGRSSNKPSEPSTVLF